MLTSTLITLSSACPQVQGRILFPAAGMLEMALGAARVACTQSATDSSRLALVGSSIAAPLIMAAAGDTALSCSLHPGTGLLELTTEAPGAVRRHLSTHAGEPIWCKSSAAIINQL